MRTFLITILILTSFSFTKAQVTQNDNYQFFVDLNNTADDRITVELITPKITSDKVMYKFPAMVPGTYKVYDFGRYVSDVKAFDESGNELNVSKQDVNSWEISDANRLYKITYKADDTFDDSSTVNPVFEPAGTSFEDGIIFVLNNHTYIGYLDNYINNDYTLTFLKPVGFYGSTSLDALQRTDAEEIFTAPDYQYVVDSPIFFNVPDTASINFDEAKILISVYSPGKGINANDIAADNKKLLEGIRNYLGGKLPSEKYTFLYYFSNKTNSSSFGALEHNQSSLYYMPDVPKEAKQFMLKQLMSTNAHEYYHTVTPLNLHSEEIGNFDFNNPVMSAHLWLYEGVTEYSADYIQLREGLMTLNEYIEAVESKLNGAAKFNDTLAFTEMSKGALDKYENQYLNVYLKGALIGMCLDILIREESNGQMGLQDVINKLLEKYGKERSFVDSELFSEIESLTSPKVREFLDKYVAGPNRIPYGDIFTKIGIDVESVPYQTVSLGGFAMGFNQKNYRLKIMKLDDPENKFVKELGLKADDELVAFNGTKITYMNMRDMLGSAKKKVKVGDDFELVVARYDENGKETQVPLKAKIYETKTAYDFKVAVSEKLTDQQQKTFDAWMGKL